MHVWILVHEDPSWQIPLLYSAQICGVDVNTSQRRSSSINWSSLILDSHTRSFSLWKLWFQWQVAPIGTRISEVIFTNVHVRAAFIRTSYIAGITTTDTCPWREGLNFWNHSLIIFLCRKTSFVLTKPQLDIRMLGRAEIRPFTNDRKRGRLEVLFAQILENL